MSFKKPKGGKKKEFGILLQNFQSAVLEATHVDLNISEIISNVVEFGWLI